MTRYGIGVQTYELATGYCIDSRAYPDLAGFAKRQKAWWGMNELAELRKLAADLSERLNLFPWVKYHNEDDDTKKRIDALYVALRAFNGDPL